MRVLMGMALVAALAMGPAADARTAPPTSDDSPSSDDSSSSEDSSSASSDDSPPKDWKKITSLRVLPELPRQNDVLRIFVHCPTTANHALIGSTAFALKGSRRLYREVGLGLSDRGLGRRAVIISYYTLLGDHDVRLKCVKVTINKKTRLRKIRLISQCTVPLTVRRFRLARFL